MIDLSKSAFQNIKVKESDSFLFPFIYKQLVNSEFVPVDLSQFDFARMQIKENEFATTTLVEFTSTGSTTGNTILMDQKAFGYIVVSGDLNLQSGTYLYDVELSNSGFTQTILQGSITITDEISL